jgi:hypothetical protein
VISFYRTLYGRHTIRAQPKLEFLVGNKNMEGAQNFAMETTVHLSLCGPEVMMKYIQNISIDSHGILWVGEEIRVLH